jgi:hypothetical protein
LTSLAYSAAALDIQGTVMDSTAQTPISGAKVALAADAASYVLTAANGTFRFIYTPTRIPIQPQRRTMSPRSISVNIKTLDGRTVLSRFFIADLQGINGFEKVMLKGLRTGVYLVTIKTGNNLLRSTMMFTDREMPVKLSSEGMEPSVSLAKGAAAASIKITKSGYASKTYTPLNETETGVIIKLKKLVLTNECLARSNVSSISGTFTSYRGKPGSGSAVDARDGIWGQNNGWLATPQDTSTGVCWTGGEFFLTLNDSVVSPTEAWSIYWHHNGGWTLKYNNANWIIDGVTVRHVGDAFNIDEGAQNFTIQNCHFVDIRDDAVQNDLMHAGTVRDNFIDGCYNVFSARGPSATVAPYDGHLNTWAINNNVIWLKPMYSIYKGDSPGSAFLFKWEEGTYLGYTPHLQFTGNIVRIEKVPFQGWNASATSVGGEKFYVPPGTEFSNNILVWDSTDPVPAVLTDWFNAAHNSRIGTMNDWNTAVAQWWAAHPGVK